MGLFGRARAAGVAGCAGDVESAMVGNSSADGLVNGLRRGLVSAKESTVWTMSLCSPTLKLDARSVVGEELGPSAASTSGNNITSCEYL